MKANLNSGLDQFLLWMAAGLSSLIYFLTFHLMKYRYKVIKKNMSASFTTQGEKKIFRMISSYYKHLGGIVIEPFLYYAVSPVLRRKLAHYTNLEMLQQFYLQKKHIILLASHYGNWEYLINLPKIVDYKVYTAYTPISNRFINNLILNMRSAFGVKLIQKKYFYRGALSALKQSRDPSMVVVIADQRPPVEARNFVDFLGQKTRAHIGAEKLAIASESAVLYLECVKKSRFHYDYTFHLISEQPSRLSPMKITDAYYNNLENNIFKEPALWLWSHDRWKGLADYKTKS